jgi:hypothetical protein
VRRKKWHVNIKMTKNIATSNNESLVTLT